MSMRKYKIIAAIGIVVMGIGSVMSCMSESAFASNVGSGLLLLSIVSMGYAFYYWRP